MTAGLLIQAGTVENYAAYTLVASLLPLLAFMDLGFGGALTNWAAEYASLEGRVAKRRLKNRILRSIRAAMVPVFCGVGLSVVVLIWSLDTNGKLLDIPGWSVAITLVVYCAGIPLSIVSKVLIGVGSTVTWILVQLIQPIVSLALVALALALARTDWVPIIPAASLLAMCGVGAYFGLRSVGLNLEFGSLFRAPEARFHESVFSTAWPMMIILVANPLALSSDRLLLTWLGDTSDVASYSLGAQLFAPALALLSATGLSLWPYFAKRHFSGDVGGPWTMIAVFSLVAVFGSLVLFWVSPLAEAVIGADKIDLPIVLLVCLAAAFVVQAAQLPLGMYMMQGAGPRIQALLLTFMFVAKFGLSVFLLPALGAGGPALATGIAILVCQVLPGSVAVLRKAY